MTPGPTPLDRLLALVKNPATPDDPALEREVWEKVRMEANLHGFAGLLARNTEGWLPASERGWHDRVLMQHYRHFQARMSLLRRLVQAFGNEGIPCVSLKGPLLAERFYPVPFLKKSGDLDLLTVEAQIGRAARLMQSLGGQLYEEEPWQLHNRRSHHLTFKFGSAENRIPVEVHYLLSMTGRRPIRSEEFVARSVKWNSPEGFTANVLSPVDEAFFLIVHAAAHCFHRLRWLYDSIAVAGSLDSSQQLQLRELVLRHRQVGRFVAAQKAAGEFFNDHLPPDCSGLPRSVLCGTLTPGRIRCMIQRPQGVRLTTAQKVAYLVDWWAMTDSVWMGIQQTTRQLSYKAAKRLYVLRGRPLGPDVLAKTIPG